MINNRILFQFIIFFYTVVHYAYCIIYYAKYLGFNMQRGPVRVRCATDVIACPNWF